MSTKKLILLMIIGFIGFATILSCNDAEEVKKDENKKEIPEALKEDKISKGSYSYEREYSDLTEALYKELAEKTPSLSNLEKLLQAYQERPHKDEKSFEEYHDKSKSYYRSANYKANEIQDSILRKKMISIISKSEEKYKAKIKGIETLLERIAKKETSLKDKHLVLKILLTLPMIEDYQNGNMVDKKSFEERIQVLDQLIEKIDSLTPAH
ncbi:MAG: hypothetical protein HYZ42_18445 [Bacteroidetes bacterium]|nr:hypothetical protein [Bacteroidota bacterium]